jgi:hypothetical protein
LHASLQPDHRRLAEEEDFLCDIERDEEQGGQSAKLRGGTETDTETIENCPMMNLDFADLTPGQYITTELMETWGVKIRAVGKANGNKNAHTPGNAARVFDTNNPVGGGHGDPDLGSPHNSCGGPGVGDGGQKGSLYENCIPMNNVLVIQDEDTAQWDDWGSGGKIDFIFTEPVFIKEVAILDVDERKPARLKWWNPAFDKVKTGTTGENGVWRQKDMDLSNVSKFRVQFPGSGGIAYLNYTFCPTGVR